MKHILLTAGLAVILTACATGPSAYGPADINSLGFQNTQIEEDRFRVSYTGRSQDEARDYVLLRAAEITLNEGYSHFKVIHGDTQADHRSSGVSTSVGVGFGGRRGYYGRRSGTSVGVGIGINDVARALNGSKVRENIEIILLRSGTDEPNVYNAKSVAESIRPEVFQ